MTAVQQFILVEPEVYLVSGLYPVRQQDRSPITTYGEMVGSFFFRVPVELVSNPGGSLVSIDLVNIGKTNTQAEPGLVSNLNGALVSSTFSSIGQVSATYTAENSVQTGGGMVSGNISSSGQVLYYSSEPGITLLGGSITEITKT